MMAFIWAAFLTCLVVLPYMLGIERGRDLEARDHQRQDQLAGDGD